MNLAGRYLSGIKCYNEKREEVMKCKYQQDRLRDLRRRKNKPVDAVAWNDTVEHIKLSECKRREGGREMKRNME